MPNGFRTNDELVTIQHRVGEWAVKVNASYAVAYAKGGEMPAPAPSPHPTTTSPAHTPLPSRARGHRGEVLWRAAVEVGGAN